MVAYLEAKGEEWVAELNTELHAAQAKRKQPVEDGYDHHVTTGGTRARLYIVAETARAQAHEAKHSSILKLMKTSGFDVKKGTGEFKNPTKGWIVHGTDAQGNPIHGL
jgi:geranylgeranyl pyrophosphate synthase